MNILHRISYGCTFVVAMTLCALAQASSAKAASFQGLGDLPGGEFSSSAYDVSADGSTVVGNSDSANGEEAFRWTQKTSIQGLGFFGNYDSGVSADGSVVVGGTSRWTEATGVEPLGFLTSGVSADGSIVVGNSNNNDSEAAVRWTQENGIETLGDSSGSESRSFAISGDGSAIVGNFKNANGQTEAFRWTEKNGIQGLGSFITEVYVVSEANGVSADGSVVVGRSLSGNNLDEPLKATEAFRWTEKDGLQALGGFEPANNSFFYSSAFDVSADGLTIIGESNSANGTEPFIWDSDNGIRALREVLTDDYELDLTGWSLTQANAISDDGLTIVGSGRNPQGNFEGWIARIDGEPNPKPVPEPSFILATAIAGGFGTLFKKLKKKAG